MKVAGEAVDPRGCAERREARATDPCLSDIL